MDREGTLEGKVWNDSTWWDLRDESNRHKIEADDRAGLDRLEGMTLGLQGKVAQYNGKPQYNFTGLYLLDQTRNPPHDFVQRSPVPLEELQSRFAKLLDATEGPVRTFLDQVFSGERLALFQVAPAAISHHHAYVHGLLEHTVAVAECALALAEVHIARGVAVDRNVVVAGALLHDLGKIEAYALNPTPDMTVEGVFIDHIALGYATFSKLADQYGLPADIKAILGHIILSHHGQKEFGSPVLPASAEALIVAASDELDFKVFCWEDSVRLLPEGECVTDFNRSTQRRFWNWNGKA
jgi:3'-5' exoribonuclease